MASKEDIKKTILRITGNPSAGAMAAIVDDLAEAIAELDSPTARGKKPEVETRVIDPSETR